MSKNSLLENANNILSAHDEYARVRKCVAHAKCYFGVIDDRDIFLNKLVFFGPPGRWKTHDKYPTKSGVIYQKIAPEGESASLRCVTNRIQALYPGKTAAQCLQSLRQDTDEWFADLLHLYVHFDVRIFSPLWVTSLRQIHHKGSASGDSSWKDKMYLVDGNHRALVYAIRLLADNDEFTPVPLLWCKSWDHILPWADRVQPEETDRHMPSKELAKYFDRAKVKHYLDNFNYLNETDKLTENSLS